MRIILVDIDHTISDAYWRDHMIGTMPWDEYHSWSIGDKPLYDICELLRAARKHDELAFVGITARPEKWRQATMAWLVRHDIRLDYLMMRAEDDYRPAPPLKLDLMDKFLAEHNLERDAVVALLEDRDDVTAAFKGVGITVLQVHARRGKQEAGI